MYIVREIFTAKPGQAGKLAKLFKKGWANMPSARVLTDLIGPYNTVVMEMEINSLADWEKMMADYKAGKMGKMDPEVGKELAHYHEMYESGRREVYQIVD